MSKWRDDDVVEVTLEEVHDMLRDKSFWVRLDGVEGVNTPIEVRVVGEYAETKEAKEVEERMNRLLEEMREVEGFFHERFGEYC